MDIFEGIKDLSHSNRTRDSVILKFVLIAIGCIIGFIYGIISPFLNGLELSDFLYAPIMGIVCAVIGGLIVIFGTSIVSAFVFFWKRLFGIFSESNENNFIVMFIVGIIVAFFATIIRFVPILFGNIKDVFIDFYEKTLYIFHSHMFRLPEECIGPFFVLLYFSCQKPPGGRRCHQLRF